MRATARSRLAFFLHRGLSACTHAALGLALLAPVAAPAATTILYDGASGAFPTTQPPATLWGLCSIVGSTPLCGGQLPSGITQAMSGGAVVLDTTSSVDLNAGYLRLAPFPLNSAPPGIRLSFRAKLESELHVSDNRAGFSVVALDSQNLGVELGFWEDRIWEQNILPGPPPEYFVHGQEAMYDTKSGFADYDLVLAGGQYTLTARRGTTVTPLLGGPLRDYSTGKFYPYAVDNFLYFGDNTGSASARVAIASISVTPVPEPETYALLLAGIALVAGAVRQRRRAAAPT